MQFSSEATSFQTSKRPLNAFCEGSLPPIHDPRENLKV
jgi:hypothetical protein